MDQRNFQDQEPVHIHIPRRSRAIHAPTPYEGVSAAAEDTKQTSDHLAADETSGSEETAR